MESRLERKIQRKGVQDHLQIGDAPYLRETKA
jgi:hypothetical protein